MSIVPAAELGYAVPEGLEALRVCGRAPQGATCRVCAAGDVGPAEHLISRDPFREVAPVLRAADLSFANLEAPLLEDFEPVDAEAGRFAAPARIPPRSGRPFPPSW